MSFFRQKKISIKKQLKVLSLGFLCIFLMLIGLFIANQINDKKLKELNNITLNLRNSISQAQVNVLEFILFDLQNEDFYTSGKSTTLLQFAQQVKKTDSLLYRLYSAPVIKKVDMEYECQHLINTLNDYAKSVDKLRENAYSRGFSQYGIIGSIDEKAKELQENIDSLSIKDLETKYYQLRAFEKQYILTKELAFQDSYNELFLEIKKWISELDSTYDDNADKTYYALDSYKKSFGKLITKDLEIGFSDKHLQEQTSAFLESGNNILDLIQQKLEYKKELSESRATILISCLSVLLLGIILLVLLMLRFKIANNLKHITKKIINVQKQPSKQIPINTSYEDIKSINGELDILAKKITECITIHQEIEKGNYNYAPKYINKNEELGKSILDLSKNLQHKNKESEKLKSEENYQNWLSSGLAKFADILRKHSKNINDLSFEIIRNLVEYLDVNQGGLFLVNDEEEDNIYLDLMASYAYNTRKFIEKRLALGETLVGSCFLEKHTIYLTKIPNDYIYISSGLGKARPSVLLLVPMISNEEVHGVIELASFNPLNNNEISFVEEVAENIASTISGVKINLKTARLLEESNRQAEKISQAEEEMRQNIEEMEATREETERREAELMRLIEAVEQTAGIIEYDFNGIILKTNAVYCNYLNYTNKELIGKHHSILERKDHLHSEDYKNFWDSMKKNEAREGVFTRSKKSGKNIFVKGILLPYINSNGIPIKVIEVVYDITKEQELENELSLLKNK